MRERDGNRWQYKPMEANASLCSVGPSMNSLFVLLTTFEFSLNALLVSHED